MDKNILIVEEDAIVALEIRQTLSEIGYSLPDVISNVEKAIVMLENKKYDLLLVDFGIKDTFSIIELSQQLIERFGIPVLFLTTYEDLDKLKSILSDKVFNFILKPFEKEELLLSIEREIYYNKLKLQIRSDKNWNTTILENMDDAIIITDNEGYIKYMNSTAEKLTNFENDETKITKFENICKLEYPEISERISFTMGLKSKGEGNLVKNNGSVSTIKYYSVPITNYRYGYQNILILLKVPEVTIKQTDEIILKMISHKFRNNLQLISSIINLQAKYITDEKNQAFFTDTQTRIRTLGYLKENNYNNNQINSEILSEYVNKIINNLFHTYKVNPDRIKLRVDIDKVSLNSEKLLPLGLIINELASNALKHGFRYITEGELTISIKKLVNGYLLSVRDTGNGFQGDYDFSKADTLGLKLVYELAGQLEGEIKVENEKGANFIIIFRS